MTSSKNTLWIAGTGVLAVLILVATYFLLVAPKRAEAADIATQTQVVAQQNVQLEQETALLKSQFADIDDRKAELEAIKATLPAEADMSRLVRQLQSTATAGGLEVTGITPGAPVAHGAAAADASAPIVDIPVTVVVEGSFASTELFVKEVQTDLGRFFLVNDLAVTTAATGDGVTTTLNGTIFVVRDVARGAAALNGASQTATTTDTSTDETSSSSESVS